MHFEAPKDIDGVPEVEITEEDVEFWKPMIIIFFVGKELSMNVVNTVNGECM